MGWGFDEHPCPEHIYLAALDPDIGSTSDGLRRELAYRVPLRLAVMRERLRLEHIVAAGT